MSRDLALNKSLREIEENVGRTIHNEIKKRQYANSLFYGKKGNTLVINEYYYNCLRTFLKDEVMFVARVDVWRTNPSKIKEIIESVLQLKIIRVNDWTDTTLKIYNEVSY